MELRKLGVEPGDESYDETYEQVFPKIEEQVEADHEKVKELGGLFILGTERHESRRIDNQLRGRSGRQGDPGESRFYLSAEDDLVRLFAGDRIYRILDRLGPVDEEGREQPIEAKMLSRTIENAQKKVEQQNFLIRKRVLEYDDVLNQQREVVYKYRREILEGRDMSEPAKEELRGVFERIVAGVHARRLRRGLGRRRPVRAGRADLRPELRRRRRRGRGARPRRADRPAARGRARGATTSARRSSATELMRNLERARAAADHRRALARAPATTWTTCARASTCAASPSSDPLVEYKNEGFALFRDLMNSIWEDFGRYIFHVEVEIEPAEAEMRVHAVVQRSQLDARRQLHGRRPGAALGALRRRRAGRRRRPADRGGRRGVRGAARGRDAPRRRARQDRPQRPLLVRLGQEVQEVPRRVGDGRAGSGTEQVPERVAKLRDQLKLLADYL